MILIDSDILVYRIGYSSEDADEGIAVWRLDNMIENIQTELDRKDYKCFLTSQDKSNFRYQVDPNYKSHRVVPKPKHYLLLREHLIDKHKAEVVTGMEADDALGIAQDDTTIIASIDKDLDQIPGMHYNFVKHKKYYVTDTEGLRWFYKQTLLGDNADGIKGIKGIGPVRANRELDKFDTEVQFFKAVRSKYHRFYHDAAMGDKELLFAGQLLKIKQTKDEPLWQFPNVK